MTLCISIAHPRQWPLREGGLARLLRYVFWRDPSEMREQVAPVGCDLGKHKSVIIQNNGPAGMLYAFVHGQQPRVFGDLARQGPAELEQFTQFVGL